MSRAAAAGPAPSSQPWRVRAGAGVDMGRTWRFTFNGRALHGHPGDTLASALLANGVRTVARSFKYHRPRGIYAAGVEEPNALVTVGDGARVQPNRFATCVDLHDGLQARSVNVWPGLGFDLGVVNDWLSPLLPAGFYNKTFMWPPRSWMFYERWIRRAAGLGRAPDEADVDRYEHVHAHVDVLVVGGGVAGLHAALQAAQAGADVILCEDQAALGGWARWVGEEGGAPVLDAAHAALLREPKVRVLTRTTAVGCYDDRLVVALERGAGGDGPPRAGAVRERLWKIRAREIVWATGSFERLLAFPGNDRPGVMLASAARRYLHQYGVAVGRRAIVFTNNDSGHAAAEALQAGGVGIAAVVDTRAAGAQPAAAHGLPVHAQACIAALDGRRAIAAARVHTLGPDGRPAEARAHLACDTVLLAGGWDAAMQLYTQSGGRLSFGESSQAFLPAHAPPGVHVCGSVNGIDGLQACAADGRRAGAVAAQACGFAAAAVPAPVERRSGPVVDPTVAVDLPRGGDKAFVDLQHDVTLRDLALAVREGYDAVEHAKRYTTTGMGIDQGKVGNVVAYAWLARLTQRRVGQVGTTTFRPPFVPVGFGALAGREVGPLFDPIKRTPMQALHEAAGALFEPVGLWRRPTCYPLPGEDAAAAVRRECRAVRQAVGLFDASTLGKIELKGPDAVTLLERLYTNSWAGLKIGHCRYGLMLRDSGMVLDDGITARLGETHFLMSTTTGAAQEIADWIEEWLQCEWPQLRVAAQPVTAAWATLCVTGPQARRLLRRLDTSIAFDGTAFPHMSVRTGTLAGVPVRILRVGFTGELSYEINVPARHGARLWELLLAQGQDLGITRIGLDAVQALRAEKGYILIGQETDGTVTPLDLGMGWAVHLRKQDFIGKRGLHCAHLQSAGRRQLVGLRPDAHAPMPREGAQLIAAEHGDRTRTPIPMIGHVTSSAYGASVDAPIALALVADGLQRIGERVVIVDRDRRSAGVITPACIYDPQGERLHGHD